MKNINIKIFFFVYLAMTEQEKLIAELGKPRLGERNVIRVRIRESKEFKVNSVFFIRINLTEIKFFKECR